MYVLTAVKLAYKIIINRSGSLKYNHMTLHSQLLTALSPIPETRQPVKFIQQLCIFCTIQQFFTGWNIEPTDADLRTSHNISHDHTERGKPIDNNLALRDWLLQNRPKHAHKLFACYFEETFWYHCMHVQSRLVPCLYPIKDKDKDRIWRIIQGISLNTLYWRHASRLASQLPTKVKIDYRGKHCGRTASTLYCKNYV